MTDDLGHDSGDGASAELDPSSILARWKKPLLGTGESEKAGTDEPPAAPEPALGDDLGKHEDDLGEHSEASETSEVGPATSDGEDITAADPDTDEPDTTDQDASNPETTDPDTTDDASLDEASQDTNQNDEAAGIQEDDDPTGYVIPTSEDAADGLSTPGDTGPVGFITADSTEASDHDLDSSAEPEDAQDAATKEDQAEDPEEPEQDLENASALLDTSADGPDPGQPVDRQRNTLGVVPPVDPPVIPRTDPSDLPPVAEVPVTIDLDSETEVVDEDLFDAELVEDVSPIDVSPENPLDNEDITTEAEDEQLEVDEADDDEPAANDAEAHEEFDQDPDHEADDLGPVEPDSSQTDAESDSSAQATDAESPTFLTDGELDDSYVAELESELQAEDPVNIDDPSPPGPDPAHLKAIAFMTTPSELLEVGDEELNDHLNDEDTGLTAGPDLDPGPDRTALDDTAPDETASDDAAPNDTAAETKAPDETAPDEAGVPHNEDSGDGVAHGDETPTTEATETHEATDTNQGDEAAPDTPVESLDDSPQDGPEMGLETSAGAIPEPEAQQATPEAPENLEPLRPRTPVETLELTIAATNREANAELRSENAFAALTTGPTDEEGPVPADIATAIESTFAPPPGEAIPMPAAQHSEPGNESESEATSATDEHPDSAPPHLPPEPREHEVPDKGPDALDEADEIEDADPKAEPKPKGGDSAAMATLAAMGITPQTATRSQDVSEKTLPDTSVGVFATTPREVVDPAHDAFTRPAPPTEPQPPRAPVDTTPAAPELEPMMDPNIDEDSASEDRIPPVKLDSKRGNFTMPAPTPGADSQITTPLARAAAATATIDRSVDEPKDWEAPDQKDQPRSGLVRRLDDHRNEIILLIALFVVALVVALWFGSRGSTSSQQIATTAAGAGEFAATAVPTPRDPNIADANALNCGQPSSEPFVPTKIHIPGITEESKVLSLPRTGSAPGVPPLTKKGKRQFAFDQPGIKPGSPAGHAVLDAHTFPDSTAIGNDLLKSLARGGLFAVTGAKGQLMCYEVDDIVEFDAARVTQKQLDRVYAQEGPPGIVVIVCSGDRLGPGNWTHRTVWFASPTMVGSVTTA